jgi:hypothetical protein
VRYPRAGIDGAGRTTVLSSVGGRIEALHSTDGRHFGRRVVISARRGGRARCGDARLDVAPSGDAIAIWGCAGPRFSERVQAAVYRP